jgi:GMP synthase (glutamine-hydrolysing)
MDTIAVVDFGGQYTHLIANRIRRLGVYSAIEPCTAPVASLLKYKGLILSGGPSSVLESGSPTVTPEIFALGIPILGLCYGHQLMAKLLGGTVSMGDMREYGIARLTITQPMPLFAGLEPSQQIWMSHGDSVSRLPDGFTICATTPDCSMAAVADLSRQFYGLQFHPEVTDTPNGMAILDNFTAICKVRREWNSDSFLKEITAEVKRHCGNRKVFLLVSGGVDSTVVFDLLNQVLGPDRVLGLHIDNGLMRHNETADIAVALKAQGFDNLHVVDAADTFLAALKGVSDPEEKRKIIGNTFLAVKESAQEELGLNIDEWLLGQGTIYPDTIESAGTKNADRIKTHHNRVDIVLELIEKGLLIEPLAQLYKDEVRQLGEKLGLPESLIWRHPFPGPGLGVRLLCSDGEAVPIDMRVTAGVQSIAGAKGFAGVVLPVRSVGVQGDGRTYAHPALLTGPRDWAKLETISTRITNTMPSVNRVVYGLSIAGTPEYRLIEAYPTKKRLDLLRQIDHLVTETLFKFKAYAMVWQMPVVLLPLVNSLGRESVVLRPIMSQEAMTARFVALPDEVLQAIIDGAQKIEGIGDLFYDISHKPPGTIEWE